MTNNNCVGTVKKDMGEKYKLNIRKVIRGNQAEFYNGQKVWTAVFFLIKVMFA